MKLLLSVLVLIAAVSASSVETLKKKVQASAFVETKSDWRQCGTPEEFEKSGEYEMEVQEGSNWADTTGWLVKCHLPTNPLRLRYDQKEYSIRWPEFMDENDLFQMEDGGKKYYGLRMQVANQEFQNWHMMHIRFPNVEHMNKFMLGAQTHLNIRLNAVDAHWRHVTEQDFVRAPVLTR